MDDSGFRRVMVGVNDAADRIDDVTLII